MKRPDLVEAWDITAPDPLLLLELKSLKNTVAVPRHWNQKCNYLFYFSKIFTDKTRYLEAHVQTPIIYRSHRNQ